jgi:hypothetical protein
VETVQRFEELRVGGQLQVAIDLQGGTELTPAAMRDVRSIVETHPGSAPMMVRWSDGGTIAARFRSRSLTLDASSAALKELRAVLGEDRVRLIRGT